MLSRPQTVPEIGSHASGQSVHIYIYISACSGQQLSRVECPFPTKVLKKAWGGALVKTGHPTAKKTQTTVSEATLPSPPP